MFLKGRNKLPNFRFLGNDHVYGHQCYIFNTLVTNSYLNVIVWEAHALLIEYEDHFNLWDSNLTRSVCPRTVYFLEFVTQSSSHYPQAKNKFRYITTPKPFVALMMIPYMKCFSSHNFLLWNLYFKRAYPFPNRSWIPLTNSRFFQRTLSKESQSLSLLLHTTL